ncbi:hypothetical protein [Agromyces seonyuensis]|uniref:Uncharacterized protein n=1 Tax=Agromyces seonyuensis TaxID=2662446 RepID=A0A6I4NZY1_9MICO|nr:hypothetical protein [Agromyces seonyuensis]MWB98035.1 hypothetical protein [Agromyces seonyuensis]
MSGLVGTGDGFTPEDEDLEAEELEHEYALAAADEDRPVDDSLEDEPLGVDAERRVDLGDGAPEATGAAEAADVDDDGEE